MPINTTKARRIRGWSTVSELKWLGGHAAESNLIIEVGVFAGRSLRCLCDNSPGHVYGVDHWQGTPTSLKQQNIFSNRRKRKAFLATVKRQLADRIDCGQLTMLEMEGNKAAEYMKPLVQWRGGADMIFIDADHSYEAVCNDIKQWQPLLKPGGLLCGHDLLWPTVQDAVQDTLGTGNWATGTSNIWFVPTSHTNH